MAQQTQQGVRRVDYRIDLRSPHDSQITVRDRPERWANLIFSFGVLIGTPMALLGYWGLLLGYPVTGFLLGFCIGGAFVALLVPNRMLIYNPEWTAYVTQDMFTGTMIPYGPGLHPSHWWEERNKNGNYSLKVITREFTAAVVTTTAKVTIKGKYEYAMNLALIQRAIGVDETTIEGGITAFIENFLTGECAGDTADGVRGRIDDLNGKLAAEFMQAQQDDPATRADERTLAKLGDQYGFITVAVVIDNIALPEEAQKTRDSIDEAVVLHEVVSRLYGYEPQELKELVKSGAVSHEAYNKMLNRAMAASNNAKMDINVLEGDIPAIVTQAIARFAGGTGAKGPVKGNKSKAKGPTKGGQP